MSRGAEAQPVSSLWRRGFLALLCVWLVVPVALVGVFAQDALPFVIAGELAPTDPPAVYSVPERSIFDVNPTFRARLCNPANEPDPRCDRLAVPFVSTPLALPLARLAAALGRDGGVLLIRLLAAASLSVGMELLWRRRAGVWPGAPFALFALALVLTPFAVFTIAFGQTSPWMFAAACAGVGARGRKGRLLSSGLWVATVAARGFPVALAALPFRLRQWRYVAAAAGWAAVVVVIAAVSVPIETVAPFVRSARALAEHSYGNPYNVSLANLLHTLVPGLGATALLGVAAASGLAAVVWLWRGPIGRLDADAQWATAWVVLLLFVPLVWWHYAWLAIPPLVLVLGQGTDRRRWRSTVIVAGVAASLLAGVNGTVGGQVVQAVALLVAPGMVVWLAPRPPGDRPAVTA